MDTWQPNGIIYPDAELVLIQATRALDLPVEHVGRELPSKTTTAIIWNRVGGADPNALMQCRVFAPTAFKASELARELASRMRGLPRLGLGIAGVFQNEGPTDLGDVPGHGPMRQMMYDLILSGKNNHQPIKDKEN